MLKEHLYGIAKEAERQKRIEKLHDLFKPEPGQTIMGKQVFAYRTLRNWFQFGRDSGKSFGASYLAIRYAVTHDKSYAVHVFPERVQGQKTLWDSGYLRDKIPQEFWLDQDENSAFNKTELLVKLDNGSRIQIFGADSPDTVLRGPKPDFCNFDEFRDFRAGVYDVMEANLIGKPLNIISTPPNVEGEYTLLQQMFKDEVKAGNKKFFYLELPTYVASSRYAPGGPLYEELMGIKRRLTKRGELSLWEREYEAKFKPGGTGAVFKTYQGNKRHIERNPSFLKEHLSENPHRLDWYCVADPSQNGTFAVIFVAVDRVAGIIYILDELAISDNSETGSLQMWAKMEGKAKEHYPYWYRWHVVYDQAAAWFYNDLDRHGIFNLESSPEVDPTHKELEDKTEQMSLLKDLFSTRGRIYISRKCENLIHEVENYQTNKKGEYHKDQKDDFIDTLRYLLKASEFEPFEIPEDAVEDDQEPVTLEQKQRALKSLENAMTGEMDQYEDEGSSEGGDDFPYADDGAY